MTTPAYNTVAWFQVGSDKPELVKKFYGELFGWTFSPYPSGDQGYELIHYPGSEGPSGGIAHTAEASANHATFLVVVEDVAATLAAAEALGAKVVTPPVTSNDGLVSADLLDTSGNFFCVFSPAPTS
ncbi:VOC family protein [Nocardia sp. NPDC050713]|uniref:VOC family protein n=1 Tax=unclassified Nocardia TaxID=2637762 RepID=UPI0033B808BD